MPLKARTGAGAVKDSAPVQSVKRAAATPEPDPRKDTLEEQDEERLEVEEEEQVSEGMGGAESDPDPEDEVEESDPPAPLSNSLGTPVAPKVEQADSSSTKAKRQYTRKTTAAPVLADGAFDLDAAKTRVSEIERAVKAIRSDTTAEIKAIEAEANAKLKELRAEHDALSSKITEAKFTL